MGMPPYTEYKDRDLSPFPSLLARDIANHPEPVQTMNADLDHKAGHCPPMA